MPSVGEPSSTGESVFVFSSLGTSAGSLSAGGSVELLSEGVSSTDGSAGKP